MPPWLALALGAASGAGAGFMNTPPPQGAGSRNTITPARNPYASVGSPGASGPLGYLAKLPGIVNGLRGRLAPNAVSPTLGVNNPLGPTLGQNNMQNSPPSVDAPDWGNPDDPGAAGMARGGYAAYAGDGEVERMDIPGAQDYAVPTVAGGAMPGAASPAPISPRAQGMTRMATPYAGNPYGALSQMTSPAQRPPDMGQAAANPYDALAQAGQQAVSPGPLPGSYWAGAYGGQQTAQPAYQPPAGAVQRQTPAAANPYTQPQAAAAPAAQPPAAVPQAHAANPSPYKAGPLQLGFGPAQAKAGMAMGGEIRPQPPSIAKPMQSGLPGLNPPNAESGMRRYSPTGPISPKESFMPKPEDMAHRLPHRVAITPRINVKLPRPKMGSAGSVRM